MKEALSTTITGKKIKAIKSQRDYLYVGGLHCRLADK